MENEKTEIISAKYITEQTNHMEYQPGMDNIGSEVQDEVISRMNAYDADAYTAADVLRALRKDVLTPEDFGALLSPAALPFLEQMAQRAQAETCLLYTSYAQTRSRHDADDIFQEVFLQTVRKRPVFNHLIKQPLN